MLKFYSRKKKREYPESRLQAAIVQHLLFSGAFFHSIPNERVCSVQMHNKLKTMGLRKGAADLCIVVDGKAHYLECKSNEGVLSKDQIAFADDCYENGIPYACVDNISYALEVLSAWGVRAGRIAA